MFKWKKNPRYDYVTSAGSWAAAGPAGQDCHRPHDGVGAGQSIKNANFTEQNLLISILDRSLFFSINETEKVFKLIVERLVWNRGTNLQFIRGV